MFDFKSSGSIKFSKKVIINIITFLLLIYFVLHSVYGSRGMIAYFKLNQKLSKASEELEYLRGQRVELSHKNQLLKLESLDKDMLDESVRKVLGFASPNELVFNVKR